MKNTRLSGHTLRREGKAYHLPLCGECQASKELHGTWTDEYGQRSLSSEGHGLCSCGEVSPHYGGTRPRKRWHDQHKITARSEGR